MGNFPPMLEADPWSDMIHQNGLNRLEPESVPGSQRHLIAGAKPTAPLWSPQNPLFWVGLVALGVAAGLFSAGGSVRVGPAKAAVKVGEG